MPDQQRQPSAGGSATSQKSRARPRPADRGGGGLGRDRVFAFWHGTRRILVLLGYQFGSKGGVGGGVERPMKDGTDHGVLLD
jgi:hypothetical protein